MIPNYKYKTVLCRYWESNSVCPLGQRCHFAHGQQEIRKGSHMNQMNQMGQMGHMGHMNQMGGMGQMGQMGQMQGGFNGRVPFIKDPKSVSKTPSYNNYKTMKCKYFELNICKHGDKCTFAHGDDDLRAVAGNGGQQQQRRPPRQQQQSLGGLDPQKGGVDQVNRVVKINQIKFIITRLCELYKGNEQVEVILNNALHLVNQERMEEAADELQQVIYNQNCPEDTKLKHTEIVKEAREYGMTLLNQIQGQQPQPQMNMGMGMYQGVPPGMSGMRGMQMPGPNQGYYSNQGNQMQ